MRDRWRLSACVSRDRLAAFRARGLACALCTRETISLSENSRPSTFPDYIADPSLLVRERLVPSLIRVRPPHSDFHTWTCSLSDYMETCALSVRERLARSDFRKGTCIFRSKKRRGNAIIAGRLGLPKSKLGAHPRTPLLLNFNYLRFQSAKILYNEERISM